MCQSPNDAAKTNAGIAALPAGDRHKLLTAERRRVALDILTERAAPVELEDLAAAIARETDDGAVDEGVVERVAVDLHHVHLPMLNEFAVIDYDPEATRVESCPPRPDS
jgi:hypothetical protein